MSTYILMKFLESAPERYDRGIRILTLGKLDKSYDRLLSEIKEGWKVLDIDCYLFVADSKGYNVWCGATGGHFTHHSVVAVLKTSGIDDLVDHRKVVLPQLAATGIETSVVRKKTGWDVVWGPVYAKDIPSFVENGKTLEMKKVEFSLPQRMEMAAMWAFPLSAAADLAFNFFWHGMLLSVMVFIWLFSFSVFAAFPLYSNLLVSGKNAEGTGRLMNSQ